MTRILILGGYGMFGARAAELVARSRDLGIVIAGRNAARAADAAAALARSSGAGVSSAVLDAAALTAADLRALGAAAVINASGPFQAQDYWVAKACIEARCHYIDLADARAFVTGISALDGAAKAAGILAVSGASTVPGLSSAVVRALVPDPSRLEGLEIAISPGNSFDPGLATTSSILSYLGRPIAVPGAKGGRTVYGWQGIGRREIKGLGRRWMGYVDIPDLDLFPAAYPRLSGLEARAGVEVGLFHLGMWGLSWLVRAGLLRKPERLAPPLLALKRSLSFLGTDRGGMRVTVRTRAPGGGRSVRSWYLVARSGHGPYIPAIASVILARKLLAGSEARRGAMPCFGLLTLEEFMAEVARLDISAQVTEP